MNYNFEKQGYEPKDGTKADVVPMPIETTVSQTIAKPAVVGSLRLIEFLDEMQKYGYKKVCVNTSHPDVPDSVSFPFGPYGSAFALPEVKHDGWPAIWKVCEKFGYAGCGNSHQHQIPTHLDAGYYKLVSGKWKKVS